MEEQSPGGEEIDAVADPGRAEDEGVSDVAVGAVYVAGANGEGDAGSAGAERAVGSARWAPAACLCRSPPLGSE